MAKTKKLLLPYAYDSTGKLVHISNAHKGETYTCPECNLELTLKVSRLSPGAKYFRRDHFAHKGGEENHCSESFLHKLFKKRAVSYIRTKIENKEKELRFEWDCEECGERHEGNLLKKAVSVMEEYNLGTCRPDIALLDNDDRIIIVIEVVVTHSPTEETIRYYKENKIGCLQINVSDFEDCEKVEEKLAYPDCFSMCRAPICFKCGNYMQKEKIIIVSKTCNKCGSKTNLAMKIVEEFKYGARFYNNLKNPDEFTEKEIELANKYGANIQLDYNKTTSEYYYTNICKNCNQFAGEFFWKEHLLPHVNELVINYICNHCKQMEE